MPHSEEPEQPQNDSQDAPAPAAASSSTGGPLQPAPAIIDVEAKEQRHAPKRRFLGPIPLTVATDTKAVEKRRKMHDMRREAMQSLLKTEGVLGIDDTGANVRRKAAKAVRTFRVRERDRLNNETERHLDVNESDSDTSSSSSFDDEGTAWWSLSRGKKKRRKEGKHPTKIGLDHSKWVGTSFDIGQEFEVETKDQTAEASSSSPTPAPVTSGPLNDSPEQSGGSRPQEAPPSPSPKPKAKRDRKQDAEQKTVDADARTFQTAPSHLTPPTRPTSTRSTTQETFVTARPEPEDREDGVDHDDFFFTPSTPTKTHPGPSPAESPASRAVGGTPDSSTHALLNEDPEQHVEPSNHDKRRPSLSRLSTTLSNASKRTIPRRLKSALRRSGGGGYNSPDGAHNHLTKVKSVQFGDNAVSPATPKPPNDDHDRVRQGNKKPADPMSVLTRSGHEVADASAGATEPAVVDNDDFMPGGVVMRDRVLVKLGSHREEEITYFDENRQRQSPCYRVEPMEEFIVAMTMVSIDFYRSWRFSIEEKLKGSKRLIYSVPLTSPTAVSVFHQRDMTLALICPWRSIMRQTVRRLGKSNRLSVSGAWLRFRDSRAIEALGVDKSGSAIFLIKFSERTRALDWHWYISGQLGYSLPKQIDVDIPALSLIIRMPIPAEAASSTVNRKDTLKTLWDIVLDNTSYAEIVQQLGEIPRPEFAWKGQDATLDWVAYSTTVTGRSREWALLASFAQQKRSGGHSLLQVRDSAHQAARVRLADGTIVEEPPDLEGYLIRHKTDATPKQLVYISTNDGTAFVSKAQVATPPLLPKRAGSTPADIFPAVYDMFCDSEKRRIAKFMEHCAGCLYLHDIVSVELVHPKPKTSSSAPVSPTAPTPAAPNQSTTTTTTATTPVRSTATTTTMTTTAAQGSADSQHRHNPMSVSHPTVAQGPKTAREFEVILRSGQKIRFESHTPEVAHEWVERLQALVRYSTDRLRVNAREQMDVVKRCTGREGFLGRILDPPTASILNTIWNWCVIDGCRPITMSGPVFIRRGKFRKFKACYAVVTSGAIVTFRLKNASGMQGRSHVWPLFGAYIYSGLLAHDELNETNVETGINAPARIYPDGLRTSNDTEDTTFCVRLTWPTGRWAKPQPWDIDDDAPGKAGSSGGGTSFKPPPLSEKPKVLLICRARSKLERNRWVWALNAEKERQARAHVQQEEKLRNWGTLPRHSMLVHVDGTVDARPSFRSHTSRSSLGSL